MYIQSPRDVKEELAKRLAFPERLYGQFSSEEIEKYASLVLRIAQERNEYVGDDLESMCSLGLSCASPVGMPRSYLISLMTAAATRNTRKRISRPLTIVELGAGSGINAISALTASPDSKVIAYEKNRKAADFMRRVSNIYKVENSLEIREEDFLTADFSSFSADVVINENLNVLLLQEPQLQVGQRILPYTYGDTAFVPRGVYFTLSDFITGTGNYAPKEMIMGEIDFRKRQETIELSLDLASEDLVSEELRFGTVMTLLDSEGVKHPLSKRKIALLPLDSLVLVRLPHIESDSSPYELVFSRPIEEPSWMKNVFPERCFSVRKKELSALPRWKEIDLKVMGC